MYTARELHQLAHIRHVKGRDSVVAEALSQSALSAVPEGIDTLAAAQREDGELKSPLTTKTALSGNGFRSRYQAPRFAVTRPQATRAHLCPPIYVAVFSSIYTNYPIQKSKLHKSCSLLRFIWLGINRDVRCWTKGCMLCQGGKIHCHNPTLLATFPRT